MKTAENCPQDDKIGIEISENMEAAGLNSHGLSQSFTRADPFVKGGFF